MPSLPYLRRGHAFVVRLTSVNGICLTSVAQYCYYRAMSTSSFVMGHKPVVCRRLHECRERVQCLLRDISGNSSTLTQGNGLRVDGVSVDRGGARTLLELQEMSERFVATLNSTIFLPRDVVHEVDDFPMFLLRYFRHLFDKMPQERPMNEETIVSGFVDWMDMVLPTTTAPGDKEVVSFVELMRLVQSFVRYHRGVRWGGGTTRAEWYRSGYLLHPWHGIYCPASHAEQMPYVHLLQWLLRSKPTGQEIELVADPDSDNNFDSDKKLFHQDDAMRWWRATERFVPPSWRTSAGERDSGGFTALDCGCHSGYMADLLLKAGARRIVGVDVSVRALGSAEATLREHLRERRSTASEAKTMRLIRCDLLPELEPATKNDEFSLKIEKSVMADAANRRRCAARHRQLPANPEGVNSLTAREDEIGPFDLIVFHPPIKPLFPSWPLLEETMSPLDFSTLDAGGEHPHNRLPVLRELLQRLLSPNGGGDNSTEKRRATLPLLKDDGYVAFILPRTFDCKSILKHITSTSSSSISFGGSSEGDSVSLMHLSDAVIGSLEGGYELVLRRRHSLAGIRNADKDVPRRHMAFLRAFAHPQCRDRIEGELDAFYRIYQTVDLLVFRKKSFINTRNDGAEFRKGDHIGGKPAENLLTYDESFEYVEYIPAEGPPLRHHWTELTPSYSYLEDDFFGANTAHTSNNSHEGNFLALGHPMSIYRQQLPPQEVDEMPSQAGVHLTRRNLQNYRSLFAAELKHKRSSRVRKMALQPLEKQEWYIDEKLVKSEGAKIDLLNELARFDMKDWD